MAGYVAEDREIPTVSSVSRKVAATMTPVASSIPAMRVRTDPRPSSQSWRRPSTWTLEG